MTNDWRTAPLGDFVGLQRGHDLPETRRRPGSVPVLGSFGVTGYHDQAIAPGPGVTIGRSGASYGVVTFSPADYWPLNTVLYVTDFHGNDPRFAYFLLKSIDFTRFNSGSAQPSLNRNYIRSIPVRVPPIPEQRTIGDSLGAIDDKIELNGRLNETLEATARAIFKSWFVDFDPVRAKLDGRQPPGMDAATAALFPESFRDSVIGQIPSGWEVGSVSDVAVNKRRDVNPADTPPGTAYVGLEHMPQRSISLAEWGTLQGVVSGKFGFLAGEILFGKLRPYFHKVGVAPVDGACSTDILVIAPKAPGWFGFVLCHCSSDEMIAHADGTSSGTRMPRTSWSELARYRLPLPPLRVAAAFESLARPMIELIRANIEEAQTLTRLRDALLPRLISGELRAREPPQPARVPG